MKTVTVVEVNDINEYPPVQSLVQVLLDNGYKVNLIGANASMVKKEILDNSDCTIYETVSLNTKSKATKWINRYKLKKQLYTLIKSCMRNSDYLWTTSMNSMRSIGKLAMDYKHVLQLMELSEYGYSFKHIIKFPIDEYARKAWKTVVPEINRAYIQKTWWRLAKTPYVLPNKPYSLTTGDLTEDVLKAIDKMKREKRKIVLYLGGIYPDRNFEDYAKAISKIDGYVLYIVGKAFSDEASKMLFELTKKYPVEYLGAFTAPKHLALVEHAYIGLLPYKPTYGGDLSELNALYCAPNKIFEYAGFGVPMVGSDVLGLRLPFEKWNMGVCCDDDSYQSIYEAISYIDGNHEEMSKNSRNFFNSIDLSEIVNSILA